MLFHGISGRAATPYNATSTSFLCVAPPIERTGTVNTGGLLGNCDRVIWMDWLAYVAGGSTVLGEPFSPGAVVNVQAWYRDSQSPGGSNLSDALEFTLAP